MRVVNSLDELLQLPSDRRVNGYGAREPLKLEIPKLARTALARAQDALNPLQARCGSLAGAGFMFLALTAGVIEVFYRNPSLLSWRAVYELVAVVVISFSIGAVAKMAACAFTRWQFARRCVEQHRELSRQMQGAA